MSKTNHSTGINRILRYIKKDFWVIILDVVAVNLAYILAIFFRFFVNFNFVGSGGRYLSYYLKFAPIYSILCLAVFASFRLYGGMWRFAGMNDMNRIVTANAITTVIQFFGSLIFLRMLPGAPHRMPNSFYILGALFQLIFVILIRFSYRLFVVERNKFASRRMETIPSLVVGSGDMAQTVRHHLEDNTPYRAVAMAGKESGRMMDGIPVIDLDDIEKQIAERKIKAVFIADKELKKEERELVNKAAEGLELEDYTGYMSNLSGFLPLTNVLEVTQAPIHIELIGEGSEKVERTFSSAEDCLAELPGEFEVKKIVASTIILKAKTQDDSWMKEYQEQTGQDVSFF